MNHPIHFMLKEYGKSIPVYEITNYTGYIPHEGDWITYPNCANSRSSVKVQGRDLEFKDGKLISVTLWI